MVKWMDELPLWAKIVFALPFIDGLAWGIYRIVKGVQQKNTAILIGGILWLFLGVFIFWILDIVTIIISGRPTILA